MNIITKMEVGKKNKERVNIYIDNEFALSISAELVYKEKLAEKQKIDFDRLKKISEEDNIIKCKNSALRIVQRSYKTEKELFDKLRLKEFNKEAIEKTIDFMKEYNFIDDNSYVKMYVKDKSKTLGKNKIKYQLSRKGINEELINRELSKLDTEDIQETVTEIALKKYKTIKKAESDNYKISQKLYRFLAMKGYEYDVIKKAINNVVNNDE